jgi:tRNA pseudouridine38-40 synthase
MAVDRNRKFRLDIEYDGTGFAGWAKQPGLATIEGALERVLGRILQQEVRLSVAGRTDAGVHARGQVVSFRSAGGPGPGKLMWSANQLLPDTIVITGAREVPEGFDARRSARLRSYTYTILYRGWPSAFRYRLVHFIRQGLDLAAMQEAASQIAGRHDFTAFTPTVTEHSYFERDIERSEWRREGELLIYHITSSSFLRGMVRSLVGTMLEIGRGRRPVDDMARLLGGAERPEAGETAMPAGLCLEKVEY